jgi:hypothetical protein
MREAVDQVFAAESGRAEEEACRQVVPSLLSSVMA